MDQENQYLNFLLPFSLVKDAMATAWITIMIEKIGHIFSWIVYLKCGRKYSTIMFLSLRIFLASGCRYFCCFYVNAFTYIDNMNKNEIECTEKLLSIDGYRISFFYFGFILNKRFWYADTKDWNNGLNLDFLHKKYSWNTKMNLILMISRII